MKSKIINRVRERAVLKTQREEIRLNWEIISAQIADLESDVEKFDAEGRAHFKKMLALLDGPNEPVAKSIARKKHWYQFWL